ncbi:hypothetical protein M2360_003023 [Rhizobium sp. SG_E_25_P2]|uniref:hypothetical protein n=1 Tax=Rhizobium sp. SG_E_25_P2 TaxID=2879942 RepID=UPI0024745FF0|nr:hypothetical protein [Rhizobium sp. SG_E_25_P2]MDH6267626.1 hypothetical protein [Rhizobium sp. SG_E_25_P2]
MFISKKVVYLEMQKTGSTHVRQVLKRYVGGKTGERHEQLTDFESVKDRLIVSSVRNPWDWYVSLWSFGCSGSGGFARYLTHAPFSEIRHAARHSGWKAGLSATARAFTRIGRHPRWRKLYSDAENQDHFREWLKLLLGAEGLFIAKEAYASSAIRNEVGFMTFRFLALTTEFNAWNSLGRQTETRQQIRDFVTKHGIARRILRMEQLNQDLHDLLAEIGKPISMETLDAIGKTNARSHAKYGHYYDTETIELVARRDWLIIERFGYTA